jgi:salicylate hydroxylase
LALGQAGVNTQLFEQSSAFAEVGAGIGLGPNAVRRLKSWGVWDVLQIKGFIPSQLDVMDAHSGATLGSLPLANAFVQAVWRTLFDCPSGRFASERVVRCGEQAR